MRLVTLARRHQVDLPDKNLAEPTLTNQRSVPGGGSEKFCQTAYEIPNETGTLDYKVFWEGWEPKVMITKVSN